MLRRVQGIRVSGKRGRDRPLVGIAFAVDVQVRTRDFYAVRVPVWRPVKVQPHENNHRPRPVLVGGFREFDLCAGHIEHEVFPLVE